MAPSQRRQELIANQKADPYKVCLFLKEGVFPLIQLLIRAFVKNYKSTADRAVRTAYGNLASLVGMACNILLCLGKLTAGTLFGSIAIMADALNNLSDASSNVVSLVGFKLAAKAPDAEHPFGHARYEYLAGLVVSVTVLGIGFSLLKESVVKVFHPTPVAFSWLSVGVLAASILVKLWMSGFNRTIGRTIGSETLMATAADSRNDVLTTSAVLLSTVLSHLTGWDVLDGLMGVAVAAFILWSGWGLVMNTLSPLLGESPSEDLVDHIEQKVLSYPGVLGMHDLMVHDYGPGRQFASAHVEMPGEGDAFEHHEILDTIEHDIKRQMGIGITLHCDPIATTGDDLRGWVKRGVLQIDPALSIHDLHEHDGFVSFDLVRPDGFDISDEELLELVTRIVHERRPDVSCVVTFDSGFSSPDRPAEQL